MDASNDPNKECGNAGYKPGDPVYISVDPPESVLEKPYPGKVRNCTEKLC